MNFSWNDVSNDSPVYSSGQLLLGKGERASGGANKDSILCDAFEAILGAVYLTHGIEKSREVVLRLVGPTLDAAALSGVALDWKTSLQEATAERGLGAPVYEVEGIGPDHQREFTAHVLVGGDIIGTGTGSTKKHAEQEAAAQAYGAIVATDAARD